jgi:hypothetical protein
MTALFAVARRNLCLKGSLVQTATDGGGAERLIGVSTTGSIWADLL